MSSITLLVLPKIIEKRAFLGRVEHFPLWAPDLITLGMRLKNPKRSLSYTDTILFFYINTQSHPKKY